jgi:primosomal protein N'
MKKLFGYGALLLGIYALYVGEKASSSSEKPYVSRSQREKQIQDEFDPVYTDAWRDLIKRMRHYEVAEYSSLLCLFITVCTTAYFELKNGGLFFLFPSFVALMASRIFFGGRVNKFQCPRCQKQPVRIDPQSRSPFSELYTADRYSTKCQSCHLPLWARNAHDENQRSYKEHTVNL